MRLAVDLIDVADPRFVVQRHRASRLHYDVRFEMDGALVSWAVPKGPTLDPDVRRAAFQVDDHPLEYYDFEGVIPAGTYGGGDVLVWDAGTYVAPKSRRPRRSVENGELHVELFGQKLRGTFVLIRTGSDNQWLLLHKHDEFAVPGWDPEDHPESVLSGRTSEEVAADPDRLWRSDLPAARAAVPLRFVEPSTDEIAELDEIGRSGTWHVHGRAVPVRDVDRQVLPGRGRSAPVRKRDLLRHAARLGPAVVPYLTGRAFDLPRSVPAGAPDWLSRWEHGTRTHLVVTEPAALVWAVNAGALAWRVDTARTDRPEQPDYALIDLDPGPDAPWQRLLALVRLYGTALTHLGLTGRPELTGSRAFQIWIPIRRGPRRDEIQSWVDRLSRTVGAAAPEVAGRTWQPTRLARSVAPYGPRPAPGAPVAAPIEWDELDGTGLRSDRFTIRTVSERLAERGDPFAAVLGHPQALPDLPDPS